MQHFICLHTYLYLVRQNKTLDQYQLTHVHEQSGVSKWPVPGTFTRLRSCIVPAEITDHPLPPPILAVVKTRSTIGLWNIFHKKLMITSIAEFSHSNRKTVFSHDQVDGIFPILKITLPQNRKQQFAHAFNRYVFAPISFHPCVKLGPEQS